MATAPILSWEELGLIQGSGWLFRDIDLFIGPRDRLALIGRNGAGKTTLFRLIAAGLEADRGKRSVQPGTSLGMFLMMIGSRNTVPPRMFLIVPFGDFHINLRLNSFTRASSAVIVAHLMPTPHSLIALAASTVI